jgi:ribosome-associated protein
VVDIAGEKQAIDTVLLDVREVCTFADYFVICSGEATRQINAIFESIERALKKEGALPSHSEGTPDSGWILMDFGDVIIHIFSTFERDYYQFDQLWSKAKTLVRIP